ncbi:MAG: hypothetical protein A4E49_02511 [Methanosaeta sp. PtaU1.Bin112]|nr:MAG: hypothetical protein A4E49_02511 [Methanosaeta sp. PtaU1.Bin112]
MSRRTEYRLLFDNQSATREQIDRIETITVEQQVDMAWEARMEIPICLDRRGRWTGWDKKFMQPETRVRVEISVVDDRFVPLIDGPLVGVEQSKQFEPGQSSLTLIARDDSVYLNRDDHRFNYTNNQSDRQIINDIFSQYKQIHDVKIDDDVSSSAGGSSPLCGNGTAMQILTDLAKVYGKHVYVLPGSDPGQSIACFKALPGESDMQTESLPPLILLGQEANFHNLDHSQDMTRPLEASASTLQSSDPSPVSSSGSYLDRTPLGETGALPEGAQPARRLLRPNPFMRRRMDRAVSATAEESSYAFQASGSTIDGCYRGVLRPYHLVAVRASESAESGSYVIFRVTHTLTRSMYSQSFTLRRNAQSRTGSESQASLRHQVG